MNTRGFIAVDRDVFEHPVFAPEPFTEREAWLWMIAEAVFKPARVRAGRVTIELQRGQLAYATRFLATKWRWSEARVRRYLGRLKNDAMIDALATRDATLITICNYDRYQSARRVDDAQSDAASDALATQRRTMEQEDTSSSSLRSEEDVVTREADQKSADAVDVPVEPRAVPRRYVFVPEAFTAFWQTYPHKVGKQDALKAFEAVAKSGRVSLDQLMNGLGRYVSTKPAERPWCNPATWLRQGRWEDEPDHLSSPAGRTSQHRRHRSPHDVFADAVASDLAQHPDSRFYQPAYRRELRGADAVTAGMTRVAERRFGRWRSFGPDDPGGPRFGD